MNKFLDRQKIFVRAGSLSKSENTNPAPKPVKSMIINPSFHYYPNAKQFGDDLALLVPQSDFIIDGE